MERFLKSRYKIGDKISENPFCATYQGSFLSSNKAVVIKIYKRGSLNSSLINKMKHKVKELTQLNHHGIAKLVDGDYGWQGFYYVREYIEGKSLAALMAEGQKFGLERAQAVAEEVCRALQPAHELGIVHGALKPTNIFLDRQGIVRLTDFVIEGEIKQAMPQKVLSLLADSHYSAPEELAGQTATQLSDQYSLGLILLELLVGRTDLVAAGLDGGLQKLRRENWIGRESAAGLPKHLQAIIAKALQADPLKRFSDIGQLRESLEHKMIITTKPPHEEYTAIFENTVTQYGADEAPRELSLTGQKGQMPGRQVPEKKRNWLLAVILCLALVSGLIYAFMFGR
ncbi:MAG: protein kinase [Candidatus Saganbacteria bacterium]|nr:protein kinase [Candidatus Saganbacteria bacterium]